MNHRWIQLMRIKSSQSFNLNKYPMGIYYQDIFLNFLEFSSCCCPNSPMKESWAVGRDLLLWFFFWLIINTFLWVFVSFVARKNTTQKNNHRVHLQKENEQIRTDSFFHFFVLNQYFFNTIIAEDVPIVLMTPPCSIHRPVGRGGR